MFERNTARPRARWRRGAAALLACVAAVTGLGVAALAQPATAAPICDVMPERCRPPVPTFTMDPSGALDAPSFTATSVRVTGWADDPNTSASINVVVSVDGAMTSSTAALSRIGHGNHGFDVTVSASPTAQHVCVTAVNVGLGNDVSLGCPKFPYSTDFSALDQCGLTKRPLTATLWQLSPPTGQVAQESTLSSGGRIGFVTGPSSTTGSLVGLSLTDPSLPGPLYRSGPMTSLPAGSPDNPAGALNVTVPCPQRLTAAEVIGMSGALNTITPPSGMTITGTLLIPGANNTVDLTLTGVFNAGLVSVPFVYTHSFMITPSTNMNVPAEIVVAAPSGSGAFAFGGVGVGLNVWAPVLEPLLTGVVTPAVQSGLNSLIAGKVASMFPGGLPPMATISAPQVVITPSGVSLTLAVGSFG